MIKYTMLEGRAKTSGDYDAQFQIVLIDWHHEPNLTEWDLAWLKLVKSKIRGWSILGLQEYPVTKG